AAFRAVDQVHRSSALLRTAAEGHIARGRELSGRRIADDRAAARATMVIVRRAGRNALELLVREDRRRRHGERRYSQARTGCEGKKVTLHEDLPPVTAVGIPLASRARQRSDL